MSINNPSSEYTYSYFAHAPRTGCVLQSTFISLIVLGILGTVVSTLALLQAKGVIDLHILKHLNTTDASVGLGICLFEVAFTSYVHHKLFKKEHICHYNPSDSNSSANTSSRPTNVLTILPFDSRKVESSLPLFFSNIFKRLLTLVESQDKEWIEKTLLQMSALAESSFPKSLSTLTYADYPEFLENFSLTPNAKNILEALFLSDLDFVNLIQQRNQELILKINAIYLLSKNDNDLVSTLLKCFIERAVYLKEALSQANPAETVSLQDTPEILWSSILPNEVKEWQYPEKICKHFFYPTMFLENRNINRLAQLNLKQINALLPHLRPSLLMRLEDSVVFSTEFAWLQIPQKHFSVIFLAKPTRMQKISIDFLNDHLMDFSPSSLRLLSINIIENPKFRLEALDENRLSQLLCFDSNYLSYLDKEIALNDDRKHQLIKTKEQYIKTMQERLNAIPAEKIPRVFSKLYPFCSAYLSKEQLATIA